MQHVPPFKIFTHSAVLTLIWFVCEGCLNLDCLCGASKVWYLRVRVLRPGVRVLHRKVGQHCVQFFFFEFVIGAGCVQISLFGIISGP